jgi:hypothetical protein
MLLSRRETIRFYTGIGIQIGLAVAAVALLFWLTATAVAWMNDMRQQIRYDMERDRRSQQEHDTFIVNERRAFDTLVRDHETTMQRLQGR